MSAPTTGETTASVLTAAHAAASPPAQRVPPPPAARLARRDAAVRVVAGSVLWLALLLVASWWVGDGGVQDLAGWASGLTAVGRLTGLAASVLLLAQVVAMVRLPVLEHAFGQDRLARLHRLLGLTSFDLMVGHVILVTWGYADGRLGVTPATFWDLATHYPGMLLAVAGATCLVMVVVTSVRAARRRLRYESWHLLHLYAYLGVGLALPHQLWTGEDLAVSTARTVFWWTLWGVAAAAVLVWRVGRPAVLNLRHRLTVVGVVDEAPDLWSVHLTGRHLDRLGATAGQFLTVRFLAGTGWTRGHPYSLSAPPDGQRLRLTVAGVGDGSRAARSLVPGTRVLFEGPYGRLSARARTVSKVAFLGAGVGVTPLRALAEELDYASGEAVYLERFTDAPLFAREIDDLYARRGLQVLRLPGRRRAAGSWLGDGVGAADDLTALVFWIPDIADRDVYLCGPPGWTALVRATLLDAGLPAERLHLETFAW
ncbi:ferredoxin reductase family protein [Luteimicrobium subarcticum]|uniref:Ferredoxin-NADP reductase n=1 Tax=Luteimicrobium subarcticum TaxID=620910 RepID=A0A2M8WT72_9MICO|nr:ferric reductase-like transmembrane domain-containing protein [Luteimicrobium subarcticum]PJI94151.1 ferredoxin-NADP reductase [Luteimicrobium subarcticum]